MVLSAVRIIKGLGLPMKYGLMPVAAVIKAAIAPVAGTIPSSLGAFFGGMRAR